MATASRANFEIVDIEDVLELDAFQAHGYAMLKVQRGDVTRAVRVKVGSVSQDLIDEYAKKAPKPPAVTKVVDPQTEEGQRLGLNSRRAVIMPDFTDEDYIKAAAEYDLSFRRVVVAHGVRSNLTLGGAAAVTPEDKYKALEERGLSTLHFGELAKTILDLTQWTEEERQRFLTPSSNPVSGK